MSDDSSPYNMKKHLPFLVYFLGMFPLGYWQHSLRAWLGDWVSFLVVIGYLFVLRLTGVLAVWLVEYWQRNAVIEHNLAVENRNRKRLVERGSQTNRQSHRESEATPQK